MEDFFIDYKLHFIDALKMLVNDPIRQCEVLGGVPVAWEIKNDLLVGKGMLSYPPNRISEKDRNLIVRLFEEIENIPLFIFNDTEDLKAMSQPVWEIPKRTAKEILESFAVVN